MIFINMNIYMLDLRKYIKKRSAKNKNIKQMINNEYKDIYKTIKERIKTPESEYKDLIEVKKELGLK